MQYITALLGATGDGSVSIETDTVRSGDSLPHLLELMASEVMREDTDIIAVWQIEEDDLRMSQVTFEDAVKRIGSLWYPTSMVMRSSWGEFLRLDLKHLRYAMQ